MKKIRRVRKARKVYGISKGDSFLTLFYSYCIKAREIGDRDQGRALSEFRTDFNQYILQKYGRQFYDEYCVFHMLNKDNKTLIRALEKKQTIFLNKEILGLKPKKDVSAQRQKDCNEKQKEKAIISRQDAVKTPPTRLTDVKPKKVPAVTVQTSEHFVRPEPRRNPHVDYTAGRIYDTLPARNINYIPPSFAKRSFKITMKRLLDDSEFVVYHQGKDANEAMALANRHSFDSARIIKVEEEGKA